MTRAARRGTGGLGLRRSAATNALIAINVLVFVWQFVAGDDPNSNLSLLEHGALYGPLVRAGQWWRIVTGAFEHANLMHIALNMFALYQLGTFVESVYGSARMLTVYAISLVGGGLAVVLFSSNDVTIGASGAIFGLFGALLAVGVRLGKQGRGLITQTLPILLINLAFTFAVPFISRSGHLGGLVAGFGAGLLLFRVPMGTRRASVGVVDTVTGESAEAELLPPEERYDR